MNFGALRTLIANGGGFAMFTDCKCLTCVEMRKFIDEIRKRDSYQSEMVDGIQNND